MKSRYRTALPSILLSFVLVALTALPPAAAFAAPAIASQSANTSQLAVHRVPAPTTAAALNALALPTTTSTSSAWQVAEARLTALLPAGTTKVQLPQLPPRARATAERSAETAALGAAADLVSAAAQSVSAAYAAQAQNPLAAAGPATQPAAAAAPAKAALTASSASPVPTAAASAEQTSLAAAAPAALPELAAMAPTANNWAVGNIVGLNCGTEIHTGPGDAYPIHTTVPVPDWAVKVIGGPRFADGQTWWDTSRFEAGDPSGGSGWVSQDQSEAATCPGGGGGGSGINWTVGELIGLCSGTEIRHGPGLAVHTIVPEDDWSVKIIGGPRSYGGETWWDTSRFAAGDPSGGTGWVSQEQTEFSCGDGPNEGYFGPLPLSAAQRALFWRLGYQFWLRFIVDPVSASTGVLTAQFVDLDIPGVAGFGLTLRRVYNSQDDRDSTFGTGWSSLLDVGLRIANDGSIDVRYEDGHGLHFVLAGDGYAPGGPGIFDTLTYDGSGFTLTRPDGVAYLFDGEGRLTTLRDRHGNTIAFEHNGDLVTRIVDTAGRAFSLTYDGAHVATLGDPLGRTWRYAYSAGDLVQATDANGGSFHFAYQGHRLTEATDPAGITYLRNTYDGENRVVEQVDGAGGHSTMTYAAGSTTLTDPLGNQTVYAFDDQKRITAITDGLGQTETFAYDAASNQTSHTDRRGNTWTYTYDERGNRLTETDPLGQVTTSTYNAFGQVTGVTDPLGRLTTNEYDVDGDLVRTVRPDGAITAATYDGSGQQLSGADANGHTTTFAYDSAGNLAQEIDPLGHVTGYAYDAVGRQLSITDPNGHTATFAYDNNDNVIRIVDPKGQVTTFAYSPNDKLVQATDRRDGVTVYTYDANLNLVSVTDPEGHTVAYTYDATSHRNTGTDARGNTTHFAYNAAYRLISSTDPLGKTTTYSSDPNGNLLAVRDPLGNVTRYAYDALNRLITETDALGGETHVVYDAGGRLLQVTDPRGASTVYAYDLLDRPVQETDALGGVWLTTYDATGNITSQTAANGHTTAFVYDAANRLVRQIDPAGHATSFEYDAAGNLVRVTDPRGFATAYTYDANDNLAAVTDALGGVAIRAYDAEDALISETDPAGHTTRFAYDLDGLLIQRTEPGGQATHRAFDAAHNLVSVTDPNGATWTYVYDAGNRATTQTDPLGQVQHFAYDAAGRRVRVTNENGIVTRTDYDAVGQVVAEVRNERPAAPADAQTNVTTRSAYDATGNRIGTTDPNGNTATFAYDLLGRLTAETDALGAPTTYTYDAVGNLVALTNARGYTTRFVYDADDLLVELIDASGYHWRYVYDAAHNRTDTIDPYGVVTHEEFDGLNRVTATLRNYRPMHVADHQTNVTTRYAYYADGLLAAQTDPLGYVTQYRFDASHRLIETEDALGGSTAYEYDANGNLLATVDANGHRTAQVYDALNRLVAQTDPEGHGTTWAYDPVGNVRFTVNGRGATTETRYDPLNRPVTSVDALGGTVSLRYDASGNLLTETDQNGHTTTFTYDAINRLLTQTDAEGYITALEYDANGNRVAQVDGNGHRTAYEFDPLDRLSAETNAENEVTRYQLDALGNRTDLIEADGVVTHYTYDPLYRLIAVTLNYAPGSAPDASTNVMYVYSYDANGNLVRILDPLGHGTTFVYDALNRLVQETNPLTSVWQYTYDAVGNLLTRQDANGALTRYAYFADGLLRHVSYPDGSTIVHVYDAAHNHTAMQDALGATTWQYDLLDRMTETTDALGRRLTYTYDAASNRTALTYPDGRTVRYGYYRNDWLKTATDPLAGVTSYARDGVGQTTLAVQPNDTVAEAAYDRANRLVSLTNRQTVGAKKTISAFRYALDEVGQRVQTQTTYGWRNPPQVTTTYSYDALRRLIRTDDSENKWTTYGWDAASNRIGTSTNDNAFSATPFDAKSETYTYDDANELLSVLSDTRSNSKPARTDGVAQALSAFRHEVLAQAGKHITATAADSLLAAADALIGQLYSSNPTSVSTTASGLTALRDQVSAYLTSGAIDNSGVANSLLAKLDHAGRANQSQTGEVKATNFDYDANGNRVGVMWPGPQGPHTQGADYAYNFENLLTQALDYQAGTGGNRIERAVTQMSYDGLNRHLVKTYDPKTGASGIKRTEYAFDALDPIAEYSMWNGQYTNLYRGDAGRLTTLHTFPSGQRYWYALDGLGSTSGLTKEQGVSVHNYRYDPFGAVVPDTGNWTEPHNHYTFTGQEWDANTGLYYFHARAYDPKRAAWTQPDPYRGRLPEPVTLHRYAYVAGNPVNWVDVLGYDRSSSGQADCSIACYSSCTTRWSSDQMMCSAGSTSQKLNAAQGTAVWDAFDAFNRFYEMAEPWISLPGEKLAYVSSYLRATGTHVDSYIRTVSGGKAFSFLGPALTLLSVGLAVPEQLSADQNRPEFDPYEKAARAALNVSGTSLVAAASIPIAETAVLGVGAAVAAISAPAWVTVGVGAVAVVGVAYGANYVYQTWLKEPFFKIMGLE